MENARFERIGRKFRCPTCRSPTKIGKVFLSANRCRSARAFTWAQSTHNTCGSKHITAKWTTATSLIQPPRVLNQSSQADGNGDYIYQGSVPATESGTYGFSVRVVPTHPCLMQAHELRLITWS